MGQSPVYLPVSLASPECAALGSAQCPSELPQVSGVVSAFRNLPVQLGKQLLNEQEEAMTNSRE